MKQNIFVYALAAALASTAACVGYESKTTTPSGPTASGADALVGTWKSASASIVPSASSCADFNWTPTQLSGTSAQGSFSATCAGGLKVSGTASGALSGTTITWGAQGVATTPEIASCAIALNGTAELGVSSIRIPYSGTTCLGPVSGVEVLNKK